MPWDNNSPDATQSVAVNTPTMLANTQWINTTSEVNHFWTGATPGAHKHIDLVKKAADQAIMAGCDLVSYAKDVGALTQLFARNGSSIMQLLGIQAFSCFAVIGGVVVTHASHNATVVREGDGIFRADFTVNLPTPNYLFLGQAFPASGDTSAVMTCHPQADNNLLTNKTAALVRFRTIKNIGSGSVSRTVVDPIQAWFICFGG